MFSRFHTWVKEQSRFVQRFNSTDSCSKSIDELLESIALAERYHPPPRVMNELVFVKSWVKTAKDRLAGAASVDPSSFQAAVSQLEQWIDAIEEEVPPLKNFILPVSCPLFLSTLFYFVLSAFPPLLCVYSVLIDLVVENRVVV